MTLQQDVAIFRDILKDILKKHPNFDPKENLKNGQKITSTDTSMNFVSSAYTQKFLPIPPNSLILDYGGGKYDSNIKYMQEKGSEVLVYDIYFHPEYNKAVFDFCNKVIHPNFIVCSNVLNVIDSLKEREFVVSEIATLSRKWGNIPVIFVLYEKNGDGVEKITGKNKYQACMKTEAYMPLVKTYFPNAIRKGNQIFCNVPTMMRAYSYNTPQTMRTSNKKSKKTTKRANNIISYIGSGNAFRKMF